MNLNLKTELNNFEYENLKESKDFVVLSGSKKVLLSAPHAVEQAREGKIKSGEYQTGLICYLLNKKGYPCFIKTTNENDDANFDLECNYKTKLKEFVKENSIKFILDTHQLSSKREMDFCIGVGNNNENLLHLKKYLDDIKYIFTTKGYSITINNPFGAKSLGTISGYTKEYLKIPSMQIEINSKLFKNNNFDKILSLIFELSIYLERIINENTTNN